MTRYRFFRNVGELAVAAAVLVIATISFKSSVEASAAVSQDVGIPLGTIAPSAVVEKLDGTKVDLKDYYGKQPVLIEFWATWCPNCKALEPALREAKAKYGSQMKFVGVAVTVNQSIARVKAYVEEYKVPLEMLWDTKGDATDVYEVPATSYIIIVDKSGKVVYGGVGSSQKIDAAIQKVLQ